MSWDLIRKEHFLNVPFTKKQIADIYNSIYGTSKQEQNLVFEKTQMVALAGSSPQNDFNLTTDKKIFYLHNSINDRQSKFSFSYGGVAVSLTGANNPNQQINNLFGTRIFQDANIGFYCVTIFKFA